MLYIPRIIDKEIDRRSKAFDAICIVGPKGCGKTRTASERSKTIIKFQDETKRDGYLRLAEDSPALFLENPKPILFDEWQDAPKIWGTVREAADNTDSTGEFFLTGSSSKKIQTPHTGTGRISTLGMLPMSLFESGESNGSVSLSSLFLDPAYEVAGKRSSLAIKDLIYAVCRGGWPRTLAIKDKTAKLEIAKDYFRQVYQTDISAIDDVKRDPVWAKAVLSSYARNMATVVKPGVIAQDVKSNYPMSDPTIASYIDALERLFVVSDIDAWMPQIRSKTAIRSAKKKIFLDPSIGVAALGLSPEYFYTDFDLFGHVFENLVLRDLLIYSMTLGGKIKHYRDDYGLECDAVLELPDGRYALIEIKTGEKRIPEAEESLLKIVSLIKDYNLKHPEIPYREPSQLMVITGTSEISSVTSNGVKVIPIGCLRD
jgi:uncharacterized protein